jgi:hypothetical protein
LEFNREVRPDLYKGFNPWDRISEADAILSLFREAGIEHAEASAEAGQHPNYLSRSERCLRESSENVTDSRSKYPSNFCAESVYLVTNGFAS